MARYVLLQIDSDKEADTLVSDMEEYPDSNLLTPVQENRITAKVVAEFQKPTAYCQCTQEQKKGKLGARGAKFGWYICGVCKKPFEHGNQVIYNLREVGRKPWEREMLLQILKRVGTTKKR
jgi:hypothetical protein